VKDVLKIIVAIIVIVIAWKIIKGLIGLLVGVAVAGLIVYGGVKLLEGPRTGSHRASFRQGPHLYQRLWLPGAWAEGCSSARRLG
jgi:hypothetical protein